MAQHLLGCSRPEHIGISNAVAAGQHRVDQGHGLVADIGPPRRCTQIHMALDELRQPQVPGQGGGEQQPGVRDRVPVVDGYPKTVQSVGRCLH